MHTFYSDFTVFITILKEEETFEKSALTLHSVLVEICTAKIKGSVMLLKS